MPRPQRNPDIYSELAFPQEGMNIVRAFEKQRAGTTAAALNMRTFDSNGRSRGSSRCGIGRYLGVQPIGNYPIQDLNYLTTDAPPPAPASGVGQFIYALTSSNGFGLGNGTSGASIATAGAVSGYAFACSCWDAAGSAYVAEVNTTSGAVNIYKTTVLGVTTLINTSLTVTTGSLRRLAGMVVIGGFLFVALTLGGLSYIHRLTTGGQIDTLNWYNPGFSLWSTNSVNCLAAIGTTLGAEGLTSTTALFSTFNSAVSPAVRLTATAYTGTLTQSFSCVDSDGTGMFYTIASVSATQIRQITVAGVQNWAAAIPGSGVAHALCFDIQNQMLVVVGAGGTYGVQSLNLQSGAVLLGNSSLGTTWDNIDTNGQGVFTLYKNSASSNDIMAVNTSFSTVWGPTTFANTTHFGASVNKTSIAGTPGLSSRIVTMMGVQNGSIFTFTSTSAIVPSGGAGVLNPNAPCTFSAQNGVQMFFLDGLGYWQYDGTTGLVTKWTLTAGTFPKDKGNNTCRLIETWNGRTVMSGLPLDSQNWFMSAVSNPHDFNTGVFPATVTMAVFGNNSPLGLLGAPVQCMIPYVDNTMIFGLSHQIWLLQGDPQNGGTFNLVTDKIGMPFGRPWCKDPNGQIYFLSSRAGVFKITPGALPVRTSESIEPLTEAINLSSSIIRLEWDVQAQGFGVWATPIAGGPTTNFFWEERTNAWWPDAYGSPGMNPNCVKAMDGDSPDQRCVFLGCQDGYIRTVNPKLNLDDNIPIASFVYFGPITTKDLDDIRLKGLHARLAASSSPVKFSIYIGNSAESAFNSQPVLSGTWTPGHNPTTMIQRAGTAVYVRIDCSGPWANEVIQAVYRREGLVRRRQ